VIENNIKEKFYKNLIVSVTCCVVVIFVIAITIYQTKFGWPFPLNTLGTLEQFGSFGDFIGGVLNPLLQFIVISMLFWSIQVQRQELTATRGTLDATKIELEETKKANKDQAGELAKQTKLLEEEHEKSFDNLKFTQSLNLLLSKQQSIEELYKKEVRYVRAGQVTEHSIEHIILREISTKSFSEAKNDSKYKVGYHLSVVAIEFTQYLNNFREILACKNITHAQALDKIDWVRFRLIKLTEEGLYTQDDLDKYINDLIDSLKHSELSQTDKQSLKSYLEISR